MQYHLVLTLIPLIIETPLQLLRVWIWYLPDNLCIFPVLWRGYPIPQMIVPFVVRTAGSRLMIVRPINKRSLLSIEFSHLLLPLPRRRHIVMVRRHHILNLLRLLIDLFELLRPHPIPDHWTDQSIWNCTLNILRLQIALELLLYGYCRLETVVRWEGTFSRGGKGWRRHVFGICRTLGSAYGWWGRSGCHPVVAIPGARSLFYSRMLCQGEIPVDRRDWLCNSWTRYNT